MTTATPTAPIPASPSPTSPSQSPAGAVRRRPRQPAAVKLLLAAWLTFFFGGMGMFVYWILADAEPLTGQPRLLTGSVLTIVVVFLSWGLLVARARLQERLDRKVKGARGAVCLNCHTILTGEGQEGTCPKCGEAFTLAHVRDVWQKHTPS